MSSRQFLIPFLCAMLLLYNALAFRKQYIQWTQNPSVPLHSLGYKFLGLEETFKNVRYAGYYTDKDIETPLNIAQFEQAQYTLAPTVLVLNRTNYPFVLFDCSSPALALDKIRELGMQPLKTNAGIILAFNPAFYR